MRSLFKTLRTIVERRRQLQFGFILAASLVIRPGAAAEPTAEEKLFDQPQATQDLDRVDGAHPADAVRCRWYDDLMIRETQTDSPGFGPSYVVHPGPGGARPACRASSSPRDIKLDMAGQALLGRKGPFAIYESTDAPGAEPFVVWDLLEAREVYSDQKSQAPTETTPAGIHAVTLEGSTLHLRYLRGYDATCSLLKEDASCWTRTMRQGHFARVIAAQPPPIADCRATYKAAGVAASNASTILYDVDMTVTTAGKVTVLSRGPIGCLPPP